MWQCFKSTRNNFQFAEIGYHCLNGTDYADTIMSHPVFSRQETELDYVLGHERFSEESPNCIIPRTLYWQ